MPTDKSKKIISTAVGTFFAVAATGSAAYFAYDSSVGESNRRVATTWDYACNIEQPRNLTEACAQYSIFSGSHYSANPNQLFFGMIVLLGFSIPLAMYCLYLAGTYSEKANQQNIDATASPRNTA